MKITISVPDQSNYVGGPNVWLSRLVPSLIEKNIEITLINCSYSDNKNDFFRNLCKKNNWNCENLTQSHFTEDNIIKLHKLLKKISPDIFIANHHVPSLFLANSIKRLGIPTIGIMHSDDDFYHEYTETYLSKKSKFNPSAVVYVSNCIENLVKKHVSDDIILKKIPYGSPIPKKTAQVPEIKNSKLPELKLVYSGRLHEEQKDISAVARAFCLACKKHPEISAIIIGEGSDRPNVEKIISEHKMQDKVVLLGRCEPEDVIKNLQTGHIFVLLSDYEGLPIALQEAMSCGLVPVCHKIDSGIDELILHGKNGFIVEDKVDDFLAKISLFFHAKNPQEYWQNFSDKSRQHIIDNFSHEACVQKWVQLLKELYKQKHNDIKKDNLEQLNTTQIIQNLPPVTPALGIMDYRKNLKNRINFTKKKISGKIKSLVK